MDEQKKTIAQRSAFVLSGGGARGYAHLGVLKAYEEYGVSPSAISATSAGSIAAAFIADGYTTDEVRQLFREFKIGLSMQWKNWKAGFLSLKKLEQVLRQTLRHQTFESLEMPLYIAATNFITGEQKIFHSGDIIPAVLAASSVPMLFPPVELDGIQYVDGGLSSNLPIEPLVDEYPDIIGVHVNPLTPYSRASGFLFNLERTLHLAIRESVMKNQLLCKVFIEPQGLGQFGMFDFSKFDEIYTTGLEYTRKMLS
ncbi:MAG: patatin-like phospholipase family protein [Chitinophaga sp.]|uniref:patatin-like phospholipase family protein n=1 Tax=Chitinophaga sp. TaxID=1869181 RepID=UPI0025BBE127|nr:patatin-like phospholipase family protein [Chitinophaga sp.]MBV8253507.1 patatin-like phospholipase family protein [Chitinophaga sp.]